MLSCDLKALNALKANLKSPAEPTPINPVSFLAAEALWVLKVHPRCCEEKVRKAGEDSQHHWEHAASGCLLGFSMREGPLFGRTLNPKP